MKANNTPENTGTLTVRVTAADGAFPIENATVGISGSDETNDGFSATQYTDRDGVTKRIPLSAPSAEFSLDPNSDRPGYASYDIDVYAKDYYRKRIYSVSVFAGINSALPVTLIPYSGFRPEGSRPEFTESVEIEGGISEGEK